MATSSPGEVLRRYGLFARKSWGQNFLHAPYIHEAIVRATGATPQDRIIEIGAGVGSLTGHLLTTGAQLWAIERDRDLCEVLRQEFANEPRMTLFEADAVRFDYRAAADDEHPRPIVVGNLPYHLTGPLLFALLAVHDCTGDWIVMVQREVAQRICAPPGNRIYGSTSVTLGRVRAVDWIIDAPPGAFLPPPKVDSAVIRLRPRAQPRGEVGDEIGFNKLVRAAFQQRRKTIANALSVLAPRERVVQWCAGAGIDPQRRPETLSCEEFAAITRQREAER